MAAGRGPNSRRYSPTVTDLQLCAAAQPGIERVKEGRAVPLVVFPRVLAIEDDADQVGRARIIQPAADLQQTVDEILGGLLRREILVEEPDAVGQLVVAEDDIRAELGVGQHAIGAVQRVRADDEVAAIALERPAQAAAQDRLVGRQPREAGGGHQRQDFRRHGPFRRPEALRRRAEPGGVRFDGQTQLRGRIFRRDQAAVGQRQAWAGPSGRLGVGEQRQDRMVVRAGRDLELAALRQASVGRQHGGRDLALFGVDQPQIGRAEPAAARP